MRIESVNSFLSSSPIWDTYSVPSVKRPEGEQVKVQRTQPDKEIKWPQPQIDTCSRAQPSHFTSASVPPISKLSESERSSIQHHIMRQIQMLNLLKV